MPYQASKIYYDGSHYIAVPKENFPSRKGRKTARKSNPQTDSVKAKFETAYAESQALPKRERRKYVTEKLQDEFADKKQTEEYVKRQTERKRNNAYKRYTRLWHKVYLQRNWNFFVTCTYSDEKHTEQTFQKTLRNTLKHLVSRKGWKYIGVWERSASARLHFHGLFYIPEGSMPGELVEVKDYSPIKKKVQTTVQNTYFNKRFGRSDFKTVDDRSVLGEAIAYLTKYMEKTGENMVYSK